MTSPFLKEMERLLSDYAEAEHRLKMVQKLRLQGGEHRLSLNIDHPDYQVVEATADIAARHLPTDTILRLLVSSAEKDLAAARAALAGAAELAPHDAKEIKVAEIRA